MQELVACKRDIAKSRKFGRVRKTARVIHGTRAPASATVMRQGTGGHRNTEIKPCMCEEVNNEGPHNESHVY
jgi:hypothetical protein